MKSKTVFVGLFGMLWLMGCAAKTPKLGQSEETYISLPPPPPTAQGVLIDWQVDFWPDLLHVILQDNKGRRWRVRLVPEWPQSRMAIAWGRFGPLGDENPGPPIHPEEIIRIRIIDPDRPKRKITCQIFWIDAKGHLHPVQVEPASIEKTP